MIQNWSSPSFAWISLKKNKKRGVGKISIKARLGFFRKGSEYLSTGTVFFCWRWAHCSVGVCIDVLPTWNTGQLPQGGLCSLLSRKAPESTTELHSCLTRYRKLWTKNKRCLKHYLRSLRKLKRSFPASFKNVSDSRKLFSIIYAELTRRQGHILKITRPYALSLFKLLGIRLGGRRQLYKRMHRIVLVHTNCSYLTWSLGKFV